MKSIITLAVLAFGCIVSDARAELPQAELKEVIKLIEDLAPPHVLAQANDAISHPEIAGHGEVERARERIARAKAASVKLQEHIKPRQNIFDYPGLLTRGVLSSSEDYSQKGYHVEYQLLIFGFESHDAHSAPEEFEVVFDDRGIIKGFVPVARPK